MVFLVINNLMIRTSGRGRRVRPVYEMRRERCRFPEAYRSRGDGMRRRRRRPFRKLSCHYFVQAAWPQSQAISASLDPASLQNVLQYFSPAGGTQTQGRWAHLLLLEAGLTGSTPAANLAANKNHRRRPSYLLSG